MAQGKSTVPEYRQRLSASPPIDFKFGPSLVDNDPVTSVDVTCPTDVEEFDARRVVSYQTVQCRFDVSAATVGKTYYVKVKVVTFSGDVQLLDLNIVVIAD